jgi:hypothetical protein
MWPTSQWLFGAKRPWGVASQQCGSAYWGINVPVTKASSKFDRITFKIYLDETSRFE